MIPKIQTEFNVELHKESNKLAIDMINELKRLEKNKNIKNYYDEMTKANEKLVNEIEFLKRKNYEAAEKNKEKEKAYLESQKSLQNQIDNFKFEEKKENFDINEYYRPNPNDDNKNINPSKQLSELYITYRAIEEYGKSKKILPDDLFKITDKAIISKLLASSYGIRKSAIVYYCKYLGEKYPISYEKKESTLISSTELEKNIQAINPSHKIVNNKDERKCTFDFNQVNYLKGTNPIYTIVYVVKISEPYSWIDLYVKLVKKIWKWHKLDLLSYRGKSFTNKTKISMGSNHDFKYMLSPIKITSDVYLETELTLDEIEENIRALKNICSISKSNIKIVYETNETNIDVTQDNVSDSV